MSTLHQTINALASELAHDLLRAIRAASLDEIAAETSSGHRTKATSPRVRRTPVELQAFVDRLVATVAKHPKGILAEDLKRAMGVAPGNVGAKKFTGPIAAALQSKRIKKSGARRGTTYHKA